MLSVSFYIFSPSFDRTLGGLDMQLRLRDHFANVFKKEKKTKSDIFKNSRAMAKLLKEAGRIKKVLSANTEHVAQVVWISLKTIIKGIVANFQCN